MLGVLVASRSDYGPTGVERGTQALEGRKLVGTLIAIAAILLSLPHSITCRDLLLPQVWHS
jgi:hypothetical protein